MHDPLSASRRFAEAARIYSRAVAIHDRTAARIRATGREDAAERVEQLAAVARDRIDQPAAMTRMYALARRLRTALQLTDLLDDALDGAITFLAADFGNIQLTGIGTKRLRLVTHRGFTEDFLDHFAVVGDEQAACGRAAAAGTQAVIADVKLDAAFAPHLAIAAASGFRAVQSTPLIDANGELRGVLSTHFRNPHRPADHELRLTAIYARLVADAIARTQPRGYSLIDSHT